MFGKFVEKDFEEMEKGDFSTFKRSNGTFGIIYCCPQCGKVSAGTNNHKFNKVTNSCLPSLVHECGFHKTLTNGKYK